MYRGLASAIYAGKYVYGSIWLSMSFEEEVQCPVPSHMIEKRQDPWHPFCWQQLLNSRSQQRRYRPEASSYGNSFLIFQLTDNGRHSISLAVKFCSAILEGFPGNSSYTFLFQLFQSLLGCFCLYQL